MTPETFTTRSASPRDQYDAWCAWCQPVLEISPVESADSGFPAENQVWKLNGLLVTKVSSPPAHMVRTNTSLRRSPVDHWVITTAKQGSIATTTAGRSIEARARQPFVWSLGKAFESQRSTVDRIELFLSRDTFRDVAPLLDAAIGSVLDTPLGRLLSDFMFLLERQLPDLAPMDALRLSSAVRAMVIACVAPSADRLEMARHQIDVGRLERVRQVVRMHLRTPSLGPDMLCQIVGISRSNLYRLFETEGGISHYIQRQRLLEAHAMLCDRQDKRAISIISEALCFPDLSSFGRAFRAMFGYSPSEARSAGLAAATAPPTPLPDKAMQKWGNFVALLRER